MKELMQSGNYHLPVFLYNLLQWSPTTGPQTSTGLGHLLLGCTEMLIQKIEFILTYEAMTPSKQLLCWHKKIEDRCFTLY